MKTFLEELGAGSIAASIVAVTVPELGGKTMYVRVMSGEEREEYERALTEMVKATRNHSRALLIACSACNVDGVRTAKVADVAEIAKTDWRILQRLAAASLKLNHLSEQAVEDTAKN